MTQWGLALLVAYIALGLSNKLTWRKAGRVAALSTAVVLIGVFASYGALR
jgi:hypothetical protein